MNEQRFRKIARTVEDEWPTESLSHDSYFDFAVECARHYIAAEQVHPGDHKGAAPFSVTCNICGNHYSLKHAPDNEN